MTQRNLNVHPYVYREMHRGNKWRDPEAHILAYVYGSKKKVPQPIFIQIVNVLDLSRSKISRLASLEFLCDLAPLYDVLHGFLHRSLNYKIVE